VSSRSDRVVRFASFEVDLRSGELRKRGVLVRLPAQPFQVLTILLERPGELISREDLRARLWPADTFVDFDRGLNKAVNRLREALGDSAESPRFIETLPKRGYRFIAPVERGSPDDDGAVEAERGLEAAVPPPPTAYETDRQPSRTRSVAWVLAATLVLAAVGAAVLSLSRRTDTLTPQDRVVVADFDNRTGDPAFTHTLKQALTLELERSRLAHVVPEREVARTLTLMQRQGASLTPDVAADVCGRTGSKATLTGSVDRLGSDYVLAIEAAECRTGAVLGRAQGRSPSKEGVLDALAAATTRLRRTLGESLSDIPSRDARVHAVLSTASLEAFEAYTTGEQLVLQGRSPVPLFTQAIERDPEFAYAHAALGLVYGALGETTPSAASTRRAYALRGRVSDWEQHFITTQYLLQVTGELEKLPALCDAWIARYPNDRTAYNRLAFAYRQLGDFERAATAYERARHIGGDHPVDLQMLATTYMNLGRFDEARTIVGTERARTPQARRLALLDYLLQFARTGPAAFVPAEAERSTVEDELTFARSNTAAYQGHLNQARRLSSMAIETAQRQGFTGRAALWLANAGLRDALAGRPDLARTGAREALALSDGWDVQAIAALALARSGELTEAAAIAERLGKMLPGHTLVQRQWLPAIRADIALAQGEPGRAVEALSTVSGYELAGSALAAAPPLYAVYLRGLAHLGAGHAADAAKDFQQIVEKRGIVINHLVGALAELQLARAHAATGSADKAGKHYGTFLATWARSDADNAVLAAARREVSRLKAR
jgi:DNA-binding winged helix-turn-helix (wHTH) protein/tetratricopeptide (TPR) repeat protein